MALRTCLSFLRSRSTGFLIANTQTRGNHISAGIYPWITPGQEEPKTHTYTGYEVSSDPEEFKYVDRLMPMKEVPLPPQHSSYPTPSGWIPPSEKAAGLPYYVNRSRYHMLPVYHQRITKGGSRQVTIIKNIDGDIWAFEADIRGYMKKLKGREYATQVHELGRFVRVKGLHLEDVAQFLLDKGF